MSDLGEKDLDDDPGDGDPDTAPDIAPDAAVPLESDPADWQEQQLDLPDPDLDERR